MKEIRKKQDDVETKSQPELGYKIVRLFMIAFVIYIFLYLIFFIGYIGNFVIKDGTLNDLPHCPNSIHPCVETYLSFNHLTYLMGFLLYLPIVIWWIPTWNRNRRLDEKEETYETRMGGFVTCSVFFFSLSFGYLMIMWF